MASGSVLRASVAELCIEAPVERSHAWVRFKIEPIGAPSARGTPRGQPAFAHRWVAMDVEDAHGAAGGGALTCGPRGRDRPRRRGAVGAVKLPLDMNLS